MQFDDLTDERKAKAKACKIAVELVTLAETEGSGTQRQAVFVALREAIASGAHCHKLPEL